MKIISYEIWKFKSKQSKIQNKRGIKKKKKKKKKKCIVLNSNHLSESQKILLNKIM